MSTCNPESALHRLDLPPEFEDLNGLIQTDLRAIVLAVSQRASERLLLTRRETKQLRQNQHFEKPSERRKRKLNAARRKQLARRQQENI